MNYFYRKTYIKPLYYIYSINVENTLATSSSSLIISNPEEESSPLVEDWIIEDTTSTSHDL